MLSPIINAQIYEYQRSNKSVVYSDQIPNDVATHSIKQINRKSKESSFFGESRTMDEDSGIHLNQPMQQKQIASDFSILTPIEGQTFWNVAKIEIKLSSSSSLLPNQSIQFLLDGQPYPSSGTQSQIFIEHLPLGSHTVIAQLLGAQQQNLKTTKKVTFFVHYGKVNMT